MIWPGILALIESKSAITDLIGTSPVRLYPGRLPQGISTFPAMTYRTVSIVGNPSFDGASTLDFNMVEFHGFATTKASLEDLMTTFREEIEDSSGTYSSLVIENVRFQDSGDEDWLDNIKKYTQSIEFQISTQR